MNQQIFSGYRCDGACETEAGCNCWSGVQVVRKASEADLDAHRAEIDAAMLAWQQAERDADTLRRRQAYMAAEAATELGTDDTEPLEWRDIAWLASVACAVIVLAAIAGYAIWG